MSFHHLAKTVKTTEVTGLHKLALVIMADLVNDKNGGGAWPSQQYMADQIGCSKRHAQRIIRDLIELGFLRVVHKGGRSGTNRYYIDLKKTTPVSPMTTPMSSPMTTFETQHDDTHVTQYYKTNITTYKPAPPAPSGAVAGSNETNKTQPAEEWVYVPAPRCRHNQDLPYYKCNTCITELAKEQND